MKFNLSLCTRYPGHGISLRVIQDLVAECPICQKDRIPLRTIPYPTSPQILAAYNHLWYKDSDITGSESQEILVEDWLSLSNAEVILVEAARPRTREMCARELILFLGKDIPQSPPVNPDNF